MDTQDAKLSVGQSVSTNLEHAWVFRGTEYEDKMSKPRTGVIVEVPWYAQHHGEGTIKVRWNSLTGSSNGDPKLWEMWVSSRLINIKAKDRQPTSAKPRVCVGHNI